MVGDGMAPNLVSGHDYVIHKDAYQSASPQRGDIVLFDMNGEHVKRIIGLPDEKITIANGSVAVDGVTLSEPYLAAGTQTTAPQSTYAVPSGSYFVMNDNRALLTDSRTLGFVPRSAIQGKF